MWAAGTILKNTKYKNMAQKLQIPAQIKASLCKSFSTSQRISQTLAVASESGGEAGWQSSQKRPELRCRPCLKTAPRIRFSEVDFTVFMFFAALAGATRAVLEAGASQKMVENLRSHLVLLG